MFGTLLEIVHTIYDLGALTAILFHVFISVFKALLTPFIWVFTFISRFFTNVVAFDYQYEPPIGYNPQAVALVQSLPFFSTLTLIIAVALFVLVLFKVFRILSR